MTIPDDAKQTQADHRGEIPPRVAPRDPAGSAGGSATLGIETSIAWLLRGGVIASFVIVAIGIGAVLITNQTGYPGIHLDDVSSVLQYRAGKPGFPNSLDEVFSGVLTVKPYAIIVLGLLVLIATPVARVAFSIIWFVRQRDWMYVLVTAFAFAMLMLSFALSVGG